MEKENVLNGSFSRSVYVVTVCRNEGKYIDSFLNGLLASEYPVHVVVVDNGSESGCIGKLESFGEKIILLRQDKNLGFGIANNVGIKYALERGADYLFLLNMDMNVPPDTVPKLLAAAEKHPDFGIISPVCLNFEKTRFEDMFFESLNIKNALYKKDARLFFSEALLSGKHEKEIYETTYINAAHWFMPASVFHRTGGFNPVFYPIYGEDEEYLVRLRRIGCKIGFIPDAVVFHDTENRQASSLPVVHFDCVFDYDIIFSSDSRCIYCLRIIILFLRFGKYLCRRDGRMLRLLVDHLKAMLKWYPVIRKTWHESIQKKSIGFYEDIPEKYIPGYLKKKN